jgi:hypothetical protein
MPIVITPSGEYVDSVTGNPVNTPLNRVPQLEGDMARFISKDPSQRSMSDSEMDMMAMQNISQGKGSISNKELDMLEGAMARENIPANLDMGMDSMMPAAELSDVDKVRMLIDMGLNPQEAMEAIAREKARPTIAPEEFGRVVGMEGGQQMADPMMREQQMGALPMARPTPPPMPMQRPFDLSNMSPEQRDMVRRGIDPFAEGMMGR